jgi:acyl carrier protein
MNSIQQVKKILTEILNLGEQGQELTSDSILLGALAELDSMAVVSVIAKLEEYYGFSIEDDEISGHIFETLGSLSTFVDSKLA